MKSLFYSFFIFGLIFGEAFGNPFVKIDSLELDEKKAEVDLSFGVDSSKSKGKSKTYISKLTLELDGKEVESYSNKKKSQSGSCELEFSISKLKPGSHSLIAYAFYGNKKIAQSAIKKFNIQAEDDDDNVAYVTKPFLDIRSIKVNDDKAEVKVFYSAGKLKSQKGKKTHDYIKTVKLELDGKKVGEFKNKSKRFQGVCTIKFSTKNLKAGTYQLIALAEQGDGKEKITAQSKPKPIKIALEEDAKPFVKILRSNFTEDSAIITVLYKSYIEKGKGYKRSSKVHKITLEIDGVEVASAVNKKKSRAAIQHFKIDLSSLPNGSHELVALAYQKINNKQSVGKSEPVKFETDGEIEDNIPPVITYSINPAPNVHGWNNQDTTIQFFASDNLSGVESVSDPVTVTTEGANLVFVGTARDKAGNEASVSVTINLDKTAPDFEATQLPLANENGWNNTDVSLSYSASDNLSGLETYTSNVTVTTEGNNQQIQGQAIDLAGNQATYVSIVNIDKTAPIVTGVLNPPANIDGWNNSDVTLGFAASDNLSGIGEVTPSSVIVLEGAGQQFLGKAVDLAGNEAEYTQVINLDKTPPTLSSLVAPAPNANGWNKSDVTVSFSASDNLSGVKTFSPAILVTTEGQGQSIIGQAQDLAGNQAEITQLVNLDKTAPTITAISQPSANENGWNNTNVTVNFNATDELSGIAEVSSAETLINEGQNQTVLGIALDLAGNQAEVEKIVNIDKTAPELFVPLPTSDYVYNITNPQYVGEISDGLSGIQASTFSLNVDGNELEASLDGNAQFSITQDFLEDGEHVLNISVSDQSNNVADLSVPFKVTTDLEPPIVELYGLRDNLIISEKTISFSGNIYDELNDVESDSFSLSLDGVEQNQIELVDGSFNAHFENLSEGEHLIEIKVSDIYENEAVIVKKLTVYIPPVITIDQPIQNLIISNDYVQVEGSIVYYGEITKLDIDGTDTTPAKNFSTQIALHEGENTIVVSAQGEGGQVGTAKVNVLVDRIDPTVKIQTPENGEVFTQSTINVIGLANDAVDGIVGNNEVDLFVNGIKADVGNRKFIAGGVPLQEGENIIRATITDKAGNSSTDEVTVIYDAFAEITLNVIQGDMQQGEVSQQLPEPVVIQLRDKDNLPVPEKDVVFRIKDNDGTIFSADAIVTNDLGRAVVVRTDAEGKAQVDWILGTRSGAAVNQLEISSPGLVSKAQVCASGLVSKAAKVYGHAGIKQKGVINEVLPHPIEAIVLDEGNNPVPNISVKFSVIEGDGHFNGNSEITVDTDSNGHAEALWVLGSVIGIDNHKVSASIEGQSDPAANTEDLASANLSYIPAVFIASGLAGGNIEDTQISGVVLDNSNVPIPGAKVEVDGYDIEAFTDEFGQFILPGVPVGKLHLSVDCSGISIPGNYSNMAYEIETLPGVDNEIGMPIVIPKLNDGVFVDGSEAVTITLPEVPGFELQIPKGIDLTFPDGSTSGYISVTRVNFEKIPMIPMDGQQPSFIVTIQPPGVKFSEPVPIQYPNISALPPGRSVELFSFDHDLESFVSLGPGTVTEDACLIKSNPGVGIKKGGWSCGGEPLPPGETKRAIVKMGPVKNVDYDICLEETYKAYASCSIPGGTWVLTAPTGVKLNGKDRLTMEGANIKFDVQGLTKGLKLIKGIYKCKVTKEVEQGTFGVNVVQLELVTPKGSPVTAPDAFGEGQNEFTFDYSSPSKLVMKFQAKADPTSATILRNIKNKVSFSTQGIGNSVLVWNPANQGGKASVGGSYLEATVEFRGLPYSNSAFGTKKIAMLCKSTVIERGDIEVFFPKSALNHPGVGSGVTPNWFYYWKEGNVCGIPQNSLYDPNASYGWTRPSVDTIIRLGPDAPTTNASYQPYQSGNTLYGTVTVGARGKGIKCVAETIEHEKYHLTLHDNYSSVISGNATGPNADPDGDELPSSAELNLDGIKSNPNDPDTFNIGGIYSTYGDNEIRCIKKEMNLTIPYYIKKDWANPGSQSKTVFGPTE